MALGGYVSGLRTATFMTWNSYNIIEKREEK